MPRKIRPLSERLWSLVVKRSANECWEWTGFVEKSGYPRIGSGMRHGRSLRANRVVWELLKGKIPKGKLVCHSCDNRRCLNPNHLFLGTHQDNMTDMVRKGRSLSGNSSPARNGHRKLVWSTVNEIRRIYARSHPVQRRLAERFGVTPPTICNILKNKIWS